MAHQHAQTPPFFQPDKIIPAKTDIQDVSLPAIAMDFLAAAFYLTAAQLEKTARQDRAA